MPNPIADLLTRPRPSYGGGSLYGGGPLWSGGSLIGYRGPTQGGMGGPGAIDWMNAPRQGVPQSNIGAYSQLAAGLMRMPQLPTFNTSPNPLYSTEFGASRAATPITEWANMFARGQQQ